MLLWEEEAEGNDGIYLLYAVPLVIGRNYTRRIVVIFITRFDVLIEKRRPCDTNRKCGQREAQASIKCTHLLGAMFSFISIKAKSAARERRR